MVCDRRARSASFRFCMFIHMAVQPHPPSAVATYIKKRTLVYNLCQELFLQFLSVRAAPWKDYDTLGAIYLFLFIGEQVGPWLEERARSVQGAVSVLTRQADTSVSCWCVFYVFFTHSTPALLYQDFSTCTGTCTSQCSLQAGWWCLTANKSKHKLWQKCSCT